MVKNIIKLGANLGIKPVLNFQDIGLGVNTGNPGNTPQETSVKKQRSSNV